MLRKYIINQYLIVIFLFIALLFTKVPFLLNFSTCLCVSSMLFSMEKIKKRYALLVFFISFFIFYIGGDLTYYLFKDIGYLKFNNYVSNYAYTVIIISNLSILIGFIFFEIYFVYFVKKINTLHTKLDEIIRKKVNNFNFIIEYKLKNILTILLVITLIISIISKLFEIKYVLDNGYYYYFVNYYKYLGQNKILLALQQIEKMLLVLITLKLAYTKNIKETYKYIILYFIYLSITLFTGQRGPFMLGVFYIIIYFFSRQEKKVFTKRMLQIFILLLPIILLILFVIGNIRFGKSVNDGIIKSLIKLVNSQGVTINTIRHEFVHRQEFPNKIYTLNFLYSGFFPLIFGFPRYFGNSIETALNTHDFNHVLAYFALGKDYLKGQGTGTSFLAETMTDGGIIYVILFSFLLSLILYLTSNMKNMNKFVQFILLLVFPSIIWSIRGNATGFISVILSPATIIPLLFLIITGYIFKSKKVKVDYE